jgi:hypothetical protein
MLNDANTQPLARLAAVRLGYPFRGALAKVPGGTVRVVQTGDLTRDGLRDRDDLLTTELPGRKEPDWLLDQDVLFVARGANPYASLMADPPPRTV